MPPRAGAMEEARMRVLTRRRRNCGYRKVLAYNYCIIGNDPSGAGDRETSRAPA
jgi:hypothetical protein